MGKTFRYIDIYQKLQLLVIDLRNTIRKVLKVVLNFLCVLSFKATQLIAFPVACWTRRRAGMRTVLGAVV